MKQLIFFFVFAFTFQTVAKETCALPSLRVPVIDQDGLAVCGSTSSAIFMQHNIPGFKGPLSYLQMSIKTGAQSSSSFKRANGSFFNEHLQPCDVVNTAMKEGWCYAEHFPLDFHQEEDPLLSQQKSLKALGNFLNENQAAMNELRRVANDPITRKEAIRRIAQIMHKNGSASPLITMQKYVADPKCEITNDIIPPEITRLATFMVNEIGLENNLQESIVAILAPKCAYQARESKVSGFTCTVMPTRRQGVGRDSDYVKDIRKELTSELCSGRSMIINACSEFMYANERIVVDNCTSATAHAMVAISGRTTELGRKQILIQNSWGRTCKFETNGVLRPAFNGYVSCERGPDGVTTGRFWIDEEYLLSNTIGAYTLKPDSKAKR